MSAWPGSYSDRAINTAVEHSRMPYLWTQTDTKNALLTSLIPLGTYLTGHAIANRDANLGKWLDTLRKPTWAPANLKAACCAGDFLTMAPLGYATYKVFKTGGGFDYRDTTIAMGLFGSTMYFYLAKSYNLSRHDLKFLHINKVLLYLSALGAAIAYGKIDQCSGYAWLPYCLWTLFGSVLSYNLWNHNGDRID